MKRILLSLLISFSVFSGFSQYLVSNWSFEDTIPCATNQFFGMPETAPPWESYRQTPNFWSLSYCGGPSMPFGFQIPKSGESLVGIGAYDSINPVVNEVFGQELLDSLISGHTYCVSFYVSLAEISKYGIDKLGALFTTFKPDATYLSTFTAIPQVENQSGQVITDTLNWIQITGSFIAQGGENFISLGNFNAIGNFQISPVTYPISSTISYYYFDDISVIDCTVGLEEMAGVNIQLHPNPATSQIKISLPNSNAFDLEIYDMAGKLVYKNQEQPGDDHVLISTIDFADGLYLLRYSQGEQLGSSKFVIQH